MPIRRRRSCRTECLESRVLLSAASLIIDANDSPQNQRFEDHTPLGTRILFTAETREHGRELWTSNGTANGTTLLKDIAPGFTSSNVTIWDTGDDTAIFTAFDGEKYGIWQSDGTRSGTSKLANLDSPHPPTNVEVVSSQIYVSSDGLHVIDMTSGEKTLLVREAITFEVIDSGIFFVSAGERYRRHSLWFMAGQTRTELISDVFLGRIHESSSGILIETFGDIGLHGSAHHANLDIWRSNGTASGTFSIKPTFPDAKEVSVAYSDKNGTYFNVFAENDFSLHFGDGSPDHTQLTEGESPFYPHWFVEHSDRLLVDNDGLRELDPESGNFEQLADGHLFASGPGGHYLHDSGDLIFFDGTVTTNLGPALADFDRPVGAVLDNGSLVAHSGTDSALILFQDTGESAPIAEIPTGRTSSGSVASNWDAGFGDGYVLATGQRIDANGVVHDDNVPNGVLFDLTDARVVFNFRHVYSIEADWSHEELASGSVRNYTRSRDHVYFTLSNTDRDIELWKTDGTKEGTAIALAQPLSSLSGCAQPELASLEDQLLFYSTESSCSGAGETTLWITDGRSGEATRLLDLGAVSYWRLEGGLRRGTSLNGHFIFAAETEEDGPALFRTDGTPEGTTKVSADVHPRPGFQKLGDHVYFIGTNPEGFVGVYRTDGSNTTLVYRPDRGHPVSLQRQNGRLFVTSLETDQYETTRTWTLRTSDGGDFNKIASNSGGRVYSIRGLSIFSSTEGTWLTDGTADGTRKILDTGQSHYAEVGERIFFISNDQTAGAEPHELFLDPAVGFRQSDLLTIHETGEIQVPVVLAAPIDEPVTVRVTVSDTGRAEVLTEELTFTPDDWHEDRIAIIRGVNDLASNGDASLTLKAEVINGDSDPAYRNLEASTPLTVTDISPEPILNGKTLMVSGTTRDDTITVERRIRDIRVDVNGAVSEYAWGDIDEFVIETGDGNDVIIADIEIPSSIRSGPGDDRIVGGSMADELRSGNGNDSVEGGDGNDQIYGGPGKDVLNGGDGRDKIRGSSGNDSIIGSVGRDDLKGGSGADTISGNEGNDRIVGGNGADILTGTEGRDTLLGGAGRDILVGGTGVDSLRGGNDQDILIAGDILLSNVRLEPIRDEWNSDRNYPQRVANIRSGESEERLNGGAFLVAGDTVTDDDAEDDLFGLGARDWFFAGSLDTFSDRTGAEELDLL